MPKTIEHFMWGYQSHFRTLHEYHAEKVFMELDSRFSPEFFLVGIRLDESCGKYPACVEPEDNFWIPSETFDGVLSDAKKIFSDNPESKFLHSHPIAQKRSDEFLLKKAIKQSILEKINKFKFTPQRMFYYSSLPQEVNGHLVSCVLGLQKEIINEYTVLEKNKVWGDKYHSWSVVTSFLGAVAEEFLLNAGGGLLKPEAGAGLNTGKERDEILRAAGSRLMREAASKTHPNSAYEVQWLNVFEECNKLSTLKYEQGTGEGHLILASKEHSALITQISFAKPVTFSNSRASRKLLELASKDYKLHISSCQIHGLVTVGEYVSSEENIYEINMQDHFCWEFGHNGQVLMRVRNGLPCLPKPAFNKDKLKKDLPRIFKHITKKQIKLIISLVKEAEQEKHGTMLVIHENAHKEAVRLGNHSTIIEPCILDEELLRCVTPIDGAVLIKPDATCYAIGVILDGMATVKGDSSRGARYNSAVRYIESQEKPCLAVVVSEDGGVNFFPDLNPAIKESDIEIVIEELTNFCSTESLNRRRYQQLLAWLEQKRFYLSDNRCKQLNYLIKKIDDRFADLEPSAFRIKRTQFIPDPQFVPELYFE